MNKNPNLKIDIDIACELLFEIVNSNCDINLNPYKLKDKNEYDRNDFENDLSEDYANIIFKVIKHIKNMYNNNRINEQFASDFLAKAILNFEYDNEMLQRIKYIIEEELNNN